MICPSLGIRAINCGPMANRLRDSNGSNRILRGARPRSALLRACFRLPEVRARRDARECHLGIVLILVALRTFSVRSSVQEGESRIQRLLLDLRTKSNRTLPILTKLPILSMYGRKAPAGADLGRV